MSSLVSRQARSILALYFRSLGLQSRNDLREHTNLLVKRSADPDEAENSAALVARGQQRVFDWATELLERLGMGEMREQMRGFLMLELSRILPERPDLFLEVSEELVEMLRERLAEHKAMLPDNAQPLEMPPQSMEDFPDLFRSEALKDFLYEDLGLARLFARRAPGQNG